METLEDMSQKIYVALFSADKSVEIEGGEHFVDTTPAGLLCVRIAARVMDGTYLSLRKT